MNEHPSLVLDESEREVEAVAVDFMRRVKEIAANKAEIKETNQELLALLKETNSKLDKLVNLKNVNAEKEAEVLDLLEHELNR